MNLDKEHVYIYIYILGRLGLGFSYLLVCSFLYLAKQVKVVMLNVMNELPYEQPPIGISKLGDINHRLAFIEQRQSQPFQRRQPLDHFPVLKIIICVHIVWMFGRTPNSNTWCRSAPEGRSEASSQF